MLADHKDLPAFVVSNMKIIFESNRKALTSTSMVALKAAVNQMQTRGEDLLPNMNLKYPWAQHIEHVPEFIVLCQQLLKNTPPFHDFAVVNDSRYQLTHQQRVASMALICRHSI